MGDKQEYTMRKFLFGTLPLVLMILFPLPSTAGVSVDVHVSLPLPPPIVFVQPPELIVLPETYVYVVPDMDVDIYFYNGWWWRLWEERWYRSRVYDSGWRYYQYTPSFYRQVPSDWRVYYSEHSWRGLPWNFQRIPHHNVQRNWRSWEKNRYWEHQQTWGVQNLRPQSRSRQPVHQVKSKQYQPHGQVIKSGRTQQDRVAGPQIRKEVKQKKVQQQGKKVQQQGKHSQQQGKHGGGNEGKHGK